ncbi:MAG: hypothetical protein BroJett030_12430 [Alphaproteobacteria bacterium]|nr:MAG: hypothetical protein BroJett030_12430 [Alphaproteobacteria bacterium]
MTFHARSVVDFGLVLNQLSRSLTDGSPVPLALDIVKEHLSAEIVLLAIAARGGDGVVFADSGHELAGEAANPPGRPAALGPLTERYQHIAASESVAGCAADYTMWVFRQRAAPRFDNEETALAGVLLAHVARALEIASRIDAGRIEKTLYCDALDRLNVGVIVVDGHGRATSVSAVAERLLHARNGLQLQAGRLRAANATEDRALQAAIRAAGQRGAAGEPAPSRGLSLTKDSGARTLGIVVRPVATGAQHGPVAVYVRDCEAAPEVASEYVRQIFDLTPAEAAVTRRLTAGLSLEDAAASLAISRNTARAHLRSIFSKSGITRQTELVRLVLSSAVMLGECPPQAA